VRILRWAGRFWTGGLAVTVVLAGLLLGLRLALPLLDTPPTLRASDPADRAEAVPARAPLILYFSGPMNPASVEAALVISPTVRWSPIWSDDRATLTISPTEALQPASDYRLTLGTRALSRNFRALAAPITLGFRTAPAPAVLAVQPPAGAAAVPLDSPISITFSRAIVPAATLMQARELPELRFDPPLAGYATWLDPATVLFRPAAPLRPATRYRATLASTLADANGAQLRDDYEWSFSTPAPQVLATTPADGARLVPPRATLALTVSLPLALESLRATLVFSPAIAGDLAATTLPDGRQLITLAPAGQLLAGTTYTATLPAGVAPAEGTLPLVQPVRWSFTTAPQPGLTARFPGEGQTLPRDQEIRLVFNTPMDRAAIQAALRLVPPATGLRVTTGDAEVRIRADLSAATVYTLTVPAELPDRNGIPLGQAYQMRFLTAPAGPALALPEVPAHLAQALPSQPADLLLQRTNLSALELDLYALDEAVLVRALGFHEADWAGFQPERYGQVRLRAWRVPLTDPLNASVESRVPITADQGAPLPAGAYYLRVRTLEGPRADLLLLVSRTRLTMQAREGDTGAGAALVWATDVISGTPLAELPIALYQGGALVQQARTDQQGIARFSGLGRAASGVVALAGGPQVGVISGERGYSGSSGGLFLVTDSTSYYPGEPVRIAGFARAEPGAAPPSVSVAIRSLRLDERIYQAIVQPGPTGVLSATVRLPPGTPPGTYSLSASAGDATVQAIFTIEPPDSTPLQLAIQAPTTLAGGDDVPLAVELRTPEGLPVAGAAISWTLTAEREPFAAGAGFTFGDDERVQAPIEQRAGVSYSDPAGRFALLITDLDIADAPMRYRFTARARTPDGAGAYGMREFRIAPASRSAGVRLASRIFAIGRPGTIELLALDASGQPAPRANLRVEVYRRTWERADSTAAGPAGVRWLPRDQIAFSRSAVSGGDGRVVLSLALASGGAYRLRISTPESADNAVYSAVSLWASAPGFSGWGQLPGDTPLLIADRDAYRPGETATLLLAGPGGLASTLVTQGAPAGLAAQLRTIRAGEPFTLTVEPGDAPSLPVSLVLAPRASASPAIAALKPLTIASTSLPILGAGRGLAVALSLDRAAYAPGATATLTITTSDADGNGVSADVLLGLANAAYAPAVALGDAFRARVAPLIGVPPAPQPGALAPSTRPRGAAGQPAVRGYYWNPALRTNATGVLTVTVQLPPQPATLSAQVWASAGEPSGQAQQTLTITEPFTLALFAPAALRAGDQLLLVAQAHNAGPAARALELNLAAAGIELLGSATPIQQAIVAPGETRRFSWPVRVLDAAALRGSLSAQVDRSPLAPIVLQQPILPQGSPAGQANRSLALLREYLDPETGQPLDLRLLRVGQLVRARLTIVNNQARRRLVIDEPLPAGATLIETTPGAFELVRAPGRLALTRASADAGILQFEYTLRMVAAGSYGVPAPEAHAADAQGYGNRQQLIVAAE
jgi:hypothetical protein